VAWQFDRPEAGEGVVQAFRRADSSYESARFKLRGLDPSARYTITNADAPGGEERTGRELMEQGLSVTLRDQPGAAVVSYRKR
jgi:alpha-galactosidase